MDAGCSVLHRLAHCLGVGSRLRARRVQGTPEPPKIIYIANIPVCLEI